MLHGGRRRTTWGGKKLRYVIVPLLLCGRQCRLQKVQSSFKNVEAVNPVQPIAVDVVL